MATDPKVIEIQKQLQLAGQNWLPQSGVMDDSTRKAIAAINKAQGFGKGIGEAALTTDTMNYLSKFSPKTTTNNQGGTQVQPDAVAQAWQAQQAPVYNGISVADYQNALLNKSLAGVNSQYDNQNLSIMQNLANILSNLDAEKATANANNKKQLENIHNNEFATTETSKELMNMAGWNPNNSGLAVGELGKIKIGADKDRADANGALVQALNDIARRATLAQTNASNEKLALDKWKANALMGAESDALINADSRNYSQYRDSMSDFYNNRDFNYQSGIDQRNFDYQKGIDERNFNYQKSVDDRNYNYQVSRDKITDAQWLSQFSEQKRQALVDEAIQRRQISVSEGNLALNKAAQAWAQNPNNPDNVYKQKQIDNYGKDNGGINSSTTIGPLYHTMMSSGNPSKWLQENSPWLSKDEISTLTTLLEKNKNINPLLPDLLK